MTEHPLITRSRRVRDAGEASLELLKRLVKDMEENPAGHGPEDDTCPECMEDKALSQDKGPCPYHAAKSHIDRMENG